MATKRTTTKDTTPKESSRTKSTVSQDGDMTCTGTCGETLPVTRFPTIRTKDGSYVRRDECRSCQTTRRAAARDAKAKAATK